MSGVKIFFAGDFCSKPSTDFITVDRPPKDIISGSDISVVNFEVPLKPTLSQLPSVCYERFFQNNDAPTFLRSLGFNLFAVANNHLFDWGVEGYKCTLDALGEDTVGAGATYQQAYKIKVVERNNIKIGFLALCYAARNGVYSDVYNHNGYGCAYINDLSVNHIIHTEKKNVDYLFLLPHAGIEYKDAPIPELMARYRDFIDWGCDGVIASHPHCPQGWEVYNGKPIFYSLGNLFFNSKNTVDYVADKLHWYEGLCVLLEVDGKNITFDVINTLNVGNKELTIDSSPNRDKHNAYLCKLLQDKDLYEQYLNTLLQETETEFFPVLYRAFVPFKGWKAIKSAFRMAREVFKGKTNQMRLPAQPIIIDDAKKALLVRIFNEKYNQH